ncbi:uncharacterized protein BDV14DRAFT_179483 [Aspergillus stella-maris]|uniref:uncharacterized protein n=1 Tax=Aspergillus stella-maris TaxID=1810926 RepID=UPI003CCCD796
MRRCFSLTPVLCFIGFLNSLFAFTSAKSRLWIRRVAGQEVSFLNFSCPFAILENIC